MAPALRHPAAGFWEVSARGIAAAVGVFTLLSALVTITISYRTTQLALASKVDITVFEAATADSRTALAALREERRAALDSTRNRIDEDRRLLLEIKRTVDEVSTRQREMVCDLLKTSARYCR